MAQNNTYYDEQLAKIESLKAAYAASNPRTGDRFTEKYLDAKQRRRNMSTFSLIMIFFIGTPILAVAALIGFFFIV